MKSHRCPSLGTVGRSLNIVGQFQRFFGLRKSEMVIKTRQNEGVLSNARYHLTADQVRRIIRACDTLRDKSILQILSFTGMRRAEVVSLDVSDIDWDEKLVVVRHGKGGKSRMIPCPDCLIVGLKALVGLRIQGALFQSRQGRLSVRQLNRIVSKAGDKAGVDNPNPKYTSITCHLFRHTFARLWKGSNGSIETLSAILGHKSVSTTWDVYGKESLEDIKHNYHKWVDKLFS